MLNLSSRLSCAASMVRRRTKITDIGTDHAYLPAHLVMSGKCDQVLACDIGIMPLENAKRTVDKYNLQDKISLRVSDGLKEVSPEEAEEITICGMGGTLISEILSAASWIKKDGMHLILQPMTHSEDVRKFLYENGFIIDEEKFIFDNKKVYCCISSVFTGEPKTEEDGFYYFGFLPPSDDIQKMYVKKQLDRIEIKLEATKAEAHTDSYQRLKKIREYYEKRMSDDSKGCL